MRGTAGGAAAVLLALLTLTVAPAGSAAQPCSALRLAQIDEQHEAACRALAAASALLGQYQDPGGERLFGSALAWIEANALESLADWALMSGGLAASESARVADRISAMLSGAFNNSNSRTACHEPECGAYDDQGWWALAWLKSYELTGDTLYLLRAVEIFEYLAQPGAAWDESVCDGGAWWSWKLSCEFPTHARRWDGNLSDRVLDCACRQEQHHQPALLLAGRPAPRALERVHRCVACGDRRSLPLPLSPPNVSQGRVWA